MRYANVTEAVGHTPVVPLYTPRRDVELFAKLELQNLFAMKDRVARQVIRHALRTGRLRPGGPIIESSSGTMALGLALVGRHLGHPVHIVTDPRIDPLTRVKLESLGCTVHVVAAMTGQGWQSARLERLAELMADLPGAFWPAQYSNPQNPEAYRDVARELVEDLGSVQVLVGATGSGGSLTGTARALRELREQPVRVVAVDSTGSVLFDQPDRPGRLQSGLGNSLHPANLDRGVIDEVHWLNDREAFSGARDLAREQQIFGGNTSGSVYRVMRWLAERAEPGTRIVGILPDRGDRYVDSVYDDGYWRENGLYEMEDSPRPRRLGLGQTATSWSCAWLRAPHAPRRVVFVESNTTGTGVRALTRARQMGLQPVLLAADPDRYIGAAATGAIVLRVPTDPYESLETVLRKRFAADTAGITTTSDFYVGAAARAAAALGTPGADPDAVHAARDKVAVRRALRGVGLAQPRFATVTAGDDLDAALAEVGLPCVLKPVDDTGSVDVRLCRDRHAAYRHASVILARRHNIRGQPVRAEVLLESYLDGPEYSVESFGAGGEQRLVGITAKRLGELPDFVEIGHVYPAPLPDGATAEIWDVVSRALKATGLTFGPVHTELRLTTDGPVIVEINPRLAGGLIPELIRRSTGVDLIEQQLCAAIGRPVTLHRTRDGFAGIRFLTAPRAGRLDRVGGADAAAAVPGVGEVVVTRDPGTAVRPARCAYDRLGHVIAEGPNAGAIAAALDAALALIHVDVTEES